MATVINITDKLKNEEKFLVIGDKRYKVNDSKNTVTAVFAALESKNEKDIGIIDEALKLLLGAEAFREIDEMNLPFNDYQAVFIGAMACVSGKSYEETEASFRG